MKDVLIFEAGIQIFIIDGSRRTDSAARAIIEAAWQVGRIHIELADCAKEDRKTLGDIKKMLIHCTMETRTTTTGERWTFYTNSGVFMDIPCNSRNYIRADKDGNLYPVEAPRTDETTTEAESCTVEETSAQKGTGRTKGTPPDQVHTNHRKAHTGQNTKPRQAARDGRKATENTRKMAFLGSDVNDRQKSTVQKHPPPFVKRFRQRFETLISDRFLRSGVRG